LPSISIRGLTKRYGSIPALTDLNLDVEEGEALGFLGLNGAGKTTTIRILLDLLRPTRGKASIFGHDCQTAGLEARASVGYLPAEMGIYPDLTGREVLDLLAGLSSRAVEMKFRSELQERFDFPDSVLGRKLREYSTGMKRKLGLIQAFQSDPRLLILDEPTEGLDPLMQEAFHNLLADARARGRTVFMSSHVLSEVDRMCDRVAVLRNGELVLLATVEERRKMAARRVRVFLDAEANSAPDLPAGIILLEGGPRVLNLMVEGPLGPLLRSIQGMPVVDIEVEEPKLEDVIMKYYRGKQ
jgi:ABC-2 type transport system ATP-binding protein